jgi:hypothetical protein
LLRELLGLSLPSGRGGKIEKISGTGLTDLRVLAGSDIHSANIGVVVVECLGM